MSATPEALSRMYPSMAAATPSSTNSPAASGSQAGSEPPAGTVAAPAPEDVAPATKTDELSEPEKELAKMQRMYPPEKVLEHIQPVWPVEMPAEQQAQLTATVHTELGRKLMLGADEAQTVVNIVSRNVAVTAEQQAAWKSESETWLRAESHRTGLSTAQMLANAKAYLARSAPATKLFTDRGLLNHPDIVKIAVERGRFARNKGLLK